MPFKEKLPEWFAAGTEPTTTQKTAGYIPGLKPPAQWFNWHLNTAYLAMKELQENAVHKEEIESRFNTINTKTVTLNAGVQILNAVKAALFSLSGATGRMLVNLLGRMGNCESVGLWSSNTTIATDTANKTSGTSSFKLTLGSVPATASASFLTTPGRKYIAVADVKNGNTSKVSISINGIAGATGNEVTSASAFAPSVVRFAATDFFHILTITGTGASGNTFFMDSVRVYEISEADYAAAASYTPAQAAAKWPYVDSVMPVRNPYAIRYGENLLPPFYEWNKHINASVIEPYKLQLKATAGNQASSVEVPCAPGKSYKVSGTIPLGTYVRVSFYDANGTFISDLFNTSITTPNNCYRMGIELQNNTAEGATGTFVFENIMLNTGSTAKPFKPREDSMLALQTDLYADPVTGANADTVFERDGQYFKSKRFESVLLDGGKISKLNNVVSGAGFKALYPVVDGANYAYVGNGVGVKFDGKILPWGSQDTTVDRWAIDSTSGNFAISVGVADSGWADSYAPTLDDIKAYFYGYKAYDANTITPANAQAMTTATWSGTGTKYWVQRVGTPNFTQSVPQQSYAGYTPYQLVYQLASPTVEPIVSEGQLTFNEGDNQIEVGTGLIVREESKPAISSNQYWINGSLNGVGKLREKTSKIIAVYKNGKKDSWGTVSHADDVKNLYGLTQAYISSARFDPSASYSTTYLTLETSPIVPFAGSYAANEKTLLVDLVGSVQQNTARVSVLENKKAEKDNPAWIVPAAILAGWSSAGEVPVGYRMEGNRVYLRGRLQGGVMSDNTVLFVLPPAYRPKYTYVGTSHTYNGTSISVAEVSVRPNGEIYIYFAQGNRTLNLNNISIPLD
ncbi:hypothetical protein [Paenibacillus polymyxa]|uniref:Tail fiber protein n=1 Tax=Paenibacillus polymyxa TaxID=1406 RepID=A0AAP4ECQ3_PAEPO|nr:hypothetical protein [Paenibacillus polymyxa]MDH2334295.1 hypothetical protein [Paenibacillus polymyxa]